MFIKVREGLIVNTDHVVKIYVNDLVAEPMPIPSNPPFQGDAFLCYQDGTRDTVSRNALSVLLDLLEVSQAFVFDPKPEDFVQPLTSKLAQILRDECPNGAALIDLVALTDEQDTWTIFDALITLATEHVVVRTRAQDGQKIHWYHASHAPSCGFEFKANDGSGLHVCDLKLGHQQENHACAAGATDALPEMTFIAYQVNCVCGHTACPSCAFINDGSNRVVCCQCRRITAYALTNSILDPLSADAPPESSPAADTASLDAPKTDD